MRTSRCASWISKRQRNQRSNCWHLLDHVESKGIPEKHLLLLLWLCIAFVWITTNWKILKELVVPDHLTCLLRNLYACQEATVRSGHGTMDWFSIVKKYDKTVLCHPAYLTYMQSTSCKMPDRMVHKLESRLQGEISITSDMQMIPPYDRKWRRTIETLDASERGEWKSWLKAQHSEN